MTDLEVKEFTLAELAEKNGKDGNDIWIVIRDNIYDVTKFTTEHPGGEDLILEVAGTDATKAFEDVGHSSDAKTILKKLKIGRLVESERKYDKKPKKTTEGDQSIQRSFISKITCGMCG